jgi:hypothetical protein
MEVDTGGYRNVPDKHQREPETTSNHHFGTSFDDVGYSSAWNLVKRKNHMKDGRTYPD